MDYSNQMFPKLNGELKNKVLYANIDGIMRQVKIISGMVFISTREDAYGSPRVEVSRTELFLNVAGLGKEFYPYSSLNFAEKGVHIYKTLEDAANNKRVYSVEFPHYKDIFRFLIGNEKLLCGRNFNPYFSNPANSFRYSWNGNQAVETTFDNALVNLQKLPIGTETIVVFDYDGCKFAKEVYNEKLRAYFESTYPTKEDCINNNKMQVVCFEEETKCENIDKFAVVKVTNWSLDDDLSVVKLGQFESKENAWECVRQELLCEEIKSINRNDIIDDGVSYSNDDGTYSFTIKIIKV